MSKKNEAKAPTRREFFVLAGSGTAAVAVATMAPQPARADEANAGQSGAGYRESAHVKKFYELARF